MAGPFPGMDPYIEFQGNWQDFHNSLIGEMRSVLGHAFPRTTCRAWTSGSRW